MIKSANTQQVVQPNELLSELIGIKNGTIEPEKVMDTVLTLVGQSFSRGLYSAGNSLIGEFIMEEDYYRIDSTAPQEQQESDIIYFSNDLNSVN